MLLLNSRASRCLNPELAKSTSADKPGGLQSGESQEKVSGAQDNSCLGYAHPARIVAVQQLLSAPACKRPWCERICAQKDGTDASSLVQLLSGGPSGLLPRIIRSGDWDMWVSDYLPRYAEHSALSCAARIEAHSAPTQRSAHCSPRIQCRVALTAHFLPSSRRLAHECRNVLSDVDAWKAIGEFKPELVMYDSQWPVRPLTTPQPFISPPVSQASKAVPACTAQDRPARIKQLCLACLCCACSQCGAYYGYLLQIPSVAHISQLQPPLDQRVRQGTNPHSTGASFSRWVSFRVLMVIQTQLT